MYFDLLCRLRNNLVLMTGDTMKSGVVESDRVKIEGRQSLHRRKMSKNAPIVNGAADDSVGYEDENMVIRQVNLAAAYHDHISCTKSADLCKIPDTKEGRVNLPCETDHIYANCSDKAKSHSMVTNSSPSKDRNEEKRQLQEMCLLQLELIKHLEEENAAKDKQIQVLKQENELLKVRRERMERRFYLMRKSVKSDESDSVSDVGSVMSDSHSQTSPTVASSSAIATEVPSPAPHPPMQLVTRYFGRRSKTIPSRALKRRYLGPPKSLPCKKSAVKESPSTASMPSASENQDEVKPPTTTSFNATTVIMPSSTEPGEEPRKVHKKHGRRPKVMPHAEQFLTTNREYYLPVCYNSGQSFDETENIDVPSWRFQPVSSFYQMEGTENIDDRVFQRRHLKCEQDEKRRKRWDMQRLREQRVAEKLKYKHGGGDKNGEDGLLQRKPESFYPNPNKFEYIEVTDTLPVLAFGQPIPLFQPSDFNLPWKVSDFRETDKTKKISTSGVRVT